MNHNNYPIYFYRPSKISFFGKGVTSKMTITIGRQEEIFDVNVKLGDTFESLRGSCDLTTFPVASVPSPFECSLTFDKEELFGAEQIFSVSGIFLPERGSSLRQFIFLPDAISLKHFAIVPSHQDTMHVGSSQWIILSSSFVPASFNPTFF